jgi:hypothetical protein
MNKVAYWHVYLTEDTGTWSGIVMEQLAAMERVNLLNRIDKLKITVVKRGDNNDCAEFAGLVSLMTDGVKQVIFDFVDNPYPTDFHMIEAIRAEEFAGVSENHTLRKIYKDCLDEDQLVLYFHTKGITANARFLKTGNFATYRNYYFWRQFLNFGALDQWASCVSMLEDGYDIAGPNFQREPVPHYSGAFWWSKSSHIRQLPDPATTQWWKDLQAKTTDSWLKNCSPRFRDELWICQADYNYSAIDMCNGHLNPASNYHPQSEYWK